MRRGSSKEEENLNVLHRCGGVINMRGAMESNVYLAASCTVRGMTKGRGVMEGSTVVL